VNARAAVAQLPQLPQLPQLTSLRFFATFWVLGFHALPRAGPLDAWAAFWNLGWMGVTFFFVLSGFILTYTYGRADKPFALRQFWVARFARVYPLYIFALLFAVPQLMHDVRQAGASVDPIDAHRLAGVVVSSVVMLQAWFGQFVCVWNCPSWSLSDEAFFYALFPLLVPLVASRYGRRVILAVAVCGMALVALGATGAAAPSLAIPAVEATLNPLGRLPEFLFGCWLGGVFLAHGPSWRAASPIAVTTALTVISLSIWAGFHTTFKVPHLVAAPLFGLLIFAVAASRSPSRGILAAAPLVLLGEASYALYMLHGPLHGYTLAAFNRAAPSVPNALRFVVYAVAALALAISSYRWLEHPMRVWIRARLGTSVRPPVPR